MRADRHTDNTYLHVHTYTDHRLCTPSSGYVKIDFFNRLSMKTPESYSTSDKSLTQSDHQLLASYM